MVDGANQPFYSAAKKCQIFSFQDVQNGRGGTKYSAPPSAARKLLESKQTHFSNSLDKAFHSPEFQAKIIFHAKLSGRFLLRQPLKNNDANSPAFGGRLTLFCLVSRSPALVHKSPAFYVHYKY